MKILKLMTIGLSISVVAFALTACGDDNGSNSSSIQGSPWEASRSI